MKKLTLLLVLSFSVSVLFAQQNKLTGPKAKNYKSWKDLDRIKIPVYTYNDAAITGAKAKNTFLVERKRGEGLVMVSDPKNKLTGPKAKNQKPWDK